MNCKPGDLAVVVKAHNPCNIGSILRVLHSHPNQSALITDPTDHIWMIEATHPQAYEINGVIAYYNRGPVPDSYLRPIRGCRAEDSAAVVDADVVDAVKAISTV